MDLNLRQCKWPELVKDYEISILYYQGKTNMLGDGLNRNTSTMGNKVSICV